MCFDGGRTMAAHVRIHFVLLVLAVAFSKHILATTGQVERLRSICSRYKRVELTRASELRGLIVALVHLRKEDTFCFGRTRAAIFELDHLVNNENNYLCSPEKINQIRDFYLKYVDKNSLAHQNETSLPKPIKKLFLSYGFEVSRVCKMFIITTLMTQSRKLLNTNDYRQLGTWTSDDSPLVKMMATPKDLDDVILPKDVFRLLQKKAKRRHLNISVDAHERISVVLQPATSRVFKNIQTVCERRFQPIYGELIMPMVTLARIGLNYKGEDLEEHLREMKRNKGVQLWYRIVYLCETVAGFEVLEDWKKQLSKEDVDYGNDESVRVLNREEAQELRKKQPSSGQVDLGPKIVYKNGGDLRLSDLVFDKKSRTLRKLVKNFEAHRWELQRIRSQIMGQTFRLMKLQLKYNKVSFVGSVLKKGRVSRMNEHLIRALDEHASSVSSDIEL